MTVREIKTKPIFTRNKILMNIIKQTKEIIPINDSIDHAILIVRNKFGESFIFNQTINEDPDLTAFIGCLEVAKAHHLSFIAFDPIDPNDPIYMLED